MQELGTGTLSSVLLEKDVSTDKEVSHWQLQLDQKAQRNNKDGRALPVLSQVAIKVVNRTTSDLQEVETELLNHSALRHPHVVQFREVFLTDKHVSGLHTAETTKHTHHSRRQLLEQRTPSAQRVPVRLYSSLAP